jgi:serine/threonine protein kinase
MTGPDDDKTVLVRRAEERASAADAPGTQPASAVSGNALPIGTRLAEFEILGLIGEGGFGIVYLAFDTQLGRNVALKEYFPGSLAARIRETQVTVRSTRYEETLAVGLKSFINEARLLAQFDHRSLVNVYRFWEANGTAYMVMPYYDGVTLKDTLRQMREPPSEPWLKALLKPLIEALGVLHGVNCYHRDIAPDNIMLLKGSCRPVLLDFGAARRVISDMSQALTVILKPGFAPIEQYAAVESMKQGPWTDIYALAAVVYCAIQGTTPPASVGRLMSDNYVPLAQAAAGRYSDAFLRAIDHALAVRPAQRPQSVESFAHELGLELTEPHPREPAGGTTNAIGPSTISADASDLASAARMMSGSSVASSMPTSSASSSSSGLRASLPSTGAAAAIAPRTARSSRATLYAGIAVALVALAGTGAWFATRPPALPATTAEPSPSLENVSKANNSPATPTPPVTQTRDAIAIASTAIAMAPLPASSEATTVAPALATPAPGTGALAGIAPAPPLPFDAAAEMVRISVLADPAIRVTATLSNTIARVNKDHLQFRLTSNRSGYVYVFVVDPAGQYVMLFPNKLDGNNTIQAGQSLSLPRSSWSMLAANPPGPNHFLALVSPEQRDFSSGGLQQGPVFAELSSNAQRDAAARRTESYSPFAGEPRCASGGKPDCASSFGATTFEIDVVK